MTPAFTCRLIFDDLFSQPETLGMYNVNKLTLEGYISNVLFLNSPSARGELFTGGVSHSQRKVDLAKSSLWKTMPLVSPLVYSMHPIESEDEKRIEINR